MSQISAEMCIKVKNPTVWKRFEKADDMGLGLARLAQRYITTYTVNLEDVSEDLTPNNIATTLAPTLGNEGIIIGYFSDYYNYVCTGYFGDVVQEGGYFDECFDEYFDEYDCDDEYDDDENNEDDFDEEFDEILDIENIAGWINRAFNPTESEKKRLEEFYIFETENGVFCDYSFDKCMPDTLLDKKWKNFKRNVCEKLDDDPDKINKDYVNALVKEWSNCSSINEFIKNIWDSRSIWNDAFEWLGEYGYEGCVECIMHEIMENDLKDERKIDYLRVAEKITTFVD